MRVAGAAVLVVITTACASVGAPAAKNARKPTDPPSGEWEVLKWELNGLVQVEHKYGKSNTTIRFEPKKWVVVDHGFAGRGERAEYYKNGEIFEIDLPDSGKRGIWKVDGDTLLLCFGRPGADRPTEFTAPKDSKRSLWTLRRKKE